MPSQRTDAAVRGFRGAVTRFSDLVPRGALRWDVERGPPPPGAAPTAAVLDGVAEDLGSIERLLARIRDSLGDRGVLVADVADLGSPARLRALLEPTDGPGGDLARPEQRLDAQRLLAACEAVGLTVRDFVPVPANAPPRPGLADALAAIGYDAAPWMGPPPPDRRWLIAERIAAGAGSAIVAGPAASRLADELPAGWETIAVETFDDVASIDRAIADARGELLWFVPAGSPATAADLDAALDRFADRPLRPAAATHPLDGLLLARRDALVAGPLGLFHDDPGLAADEWLLRVGRSGRTVANYQPPAPWTPTPGPPTPTAAARSTFAQLWPTPRPEPAPPELPVRPAAAPEPAPRLALCMIVRDEQRFLDDCLRRAAAWVDEIVVVDTGSTDATVTIAGRHGARIRHVPWRDDFAAARNASLAGTDADWIVVLDADEFVDPADAPRIRAAIASPHHAGFALRMRCRVAGDDAPTRDASLLRLFRNLPGVRFRGRIHEQVWPDLLTAAEPLGLTVGELDVAIDHRGYLPEIWVERDKQTRNERLFRQQLDETPDDPYHLFKFGEFLLRDRSRAAEARRLLERALAAFDRWPPPIRRRSPYAAQSIALLADLLRRSGETDRAAALCALGCREFRPSPDLHFVAAELAALRNDTVAALLHLEACRSFAGRLLPLPPSPGITSWRAFTLAAELHARRHEPTRAAAALDRARRAARREGVEATTADEFLGLAESRTALAGGDPATALTALTALLRRRPDSTAAIRACAGLLERLGDGEHARQLRSRLGVDDPR